MRGLGVQLSSVGATERGAKSRWSQLYRQFKPQSLSSVVLSANERRREIERERERIEIGERSFYPCKPNCGYYSVGGSFCSSIVNLPFRGTLLVCLCRISSNDAADTAANVRRRSIDKPPVVYATLRARVYAFVARHVRGIRRSDFERNHFSFLSFARSISKVEK